MSRNAISPNGVCSVPTDAALPLVSAAGSADSAQFLKVFKPSSTAFAYGTRVYYADTDAGGVMYHANFFVLMERARVEWLRSLKIESAALTQRYGVTFLVRALTMDYLAPARLDDLLTITTEISSLGHRRLALAQAFLRDGNCLAYGEVNLVCVGVHSGRAVAIPQVIRGALEVPA